MITDCEVFLTIADGVQVTNVADPAVWYPVTGWSTKNPAYPRGLIVDLTNGTIECRQPGKYKVDFSISGVNDALSGNGIQYVRIEKATRPTTTGGSYSYSGVANCVVGAATAASNNCRTNAVQGVVDLKVGDRVRVAILLTTAQANNDFTVQGGGQLMVRGIDFTIRQS